MLTAFQLEGLRIETLTHYQTLFCTLITWLAKMSSTEAEAKGQSKSRRPEAKTFAPLLIDQFVIRPEGRSD